MFVHDFHGHGGSESRPCDRICMRGPFDERDLLGAKIIKIETQRVGYQPQIIVEKDNKRYSICTGNCGNVIITEVPNGI